MLQIILLLNLVAGCFSQGCTSYTCLLQQTAGDFTNAQQGRLLEDLIEDTDPPTDYTPPATAAPYTPPTPAPIPNTPSPSLFTAPPFAPVTAFPSPALTLSECAQHKQAFDQECCTVSVLDALYNNCTLEAEWFQENCDCV